MKWITASDIDDWTEKESRRAQETLPLLVWKLVIASCPNIIDHHFPYGNAVQFPGYDGGTTLKEDDITAFCPAGKAVWELGTDYDILGKFKGDYKKRTDDPKGIDPSETTFCFVTSRIWHHQQSIVEVTEEKCKEGKWKQVKIFDANSLEQWLDQCPSVSLWFSEVVGKSHTCAYDIKTYWDNEIKSTRPNLNADYFLFNRPSILEKLLEEVEKKAKQIVLVAPSSKEALLTLAAQLVTTENLKLRGIAEKCIVVSNQQTLSAIDAQYSNAILIPTFYINFNNTGTIKNTLVLPVNKYDHYDRIYKQGDRIDIVSRSPHDFCVAIEKLGIETNEAYHLGKDLRCNFLALLRKISINPSDKIPQWCEDETILNDLFPAMMAGKWEENYSGDQEILSEFAEKTYDTFIKPIRTRVKEEKYPIFGIDGAYFCISISEIWDMLFSSLTEEHLDIFEKCFLKVFSEIDPKFELPEKDWMMAGVLGKKSKYSPQLKDGLINSLIMMKEREESDSGNFSPSIHLRCDSLVNKLFSTIESENHWRSISGYLPLLIEAAPDATLSTLEKKCASNTSEIWKLFVDPDDTLMGYSFYPYIFRALEISLWDKAYASRSLSILLKFANIPEFSNLSNPPIEILYRIFCLWHPQGAFDTEERKMLIECILSKYHSIGIQLANKLLSKSSQTTVSLPLPKWHEIETNISNVTKKEYREMSDYIAQRYIEHIRPYADDWIPVFLNFPAFGSLETIINIYKKSPIDPKSKDALRFCSTLCKWLSECRKFNKYNEEDLALLEKFYFDTLPNTPEKCSSYFSYNFYGFRPIPYNKEEFKLHEENEKQLFSFRCEEIRKLMAEYGEQAVIDILPDVEDKYHYAEVLIEVILQKQFIWSFIERIKKQDEWTANRIINILCGDIGTEILYQQSEQISPADLGWILSCLNITPEVVNFVASQKNSDCSQSYWEHVQLWRADITNLTFTREIVRSFIQYHRPYSVIDWLAYTDWCEPNMIIQVLQQGLEQYPKSEPNGTTLSSVSRVPSATRKALE